MKTLDAVHVCVQYSTMFCVYIITSCVKLRAQKKVEDGENIFDSENAGGCIMWC